MSENRALRAGLKQDYQDIFVEPWAPHIGAILLVLLILLLLVKGTFWGVFGGLRLWGDWINNLIGLGPLLGIKANLEAPLLHRMSLMNIMLILGALAAALMSRQFSIYRAPRLEYLWGALGGTLMGVGATLAGGCTTGGFFTPAMNSSPAGWAMALGLMAGAWVGLKMLVWTFEHIDWGMQAPAPFDPPLRAMFPFAGLALLVAVAGWTIAWAHASDEQLAARAIIICCGFLMGFVMHRSRICFARVFHEPLMTGGSEMSKAILLALVIGIPAAALLFQKKLVDPYDAIPATFWLGSLLGGGIFGIGMIFAGGCASGALWRAGEGHLKLWLALLFFAWGGSTFSAVLARWSVMTREAGDDNIEYTRVGFQAYLPDLLGSQELALLAGLAALAVWYCWLRYNETSEH